MKNVIFKYMKSDPPLPKFWLSQPVLYTESHALKSSLFMVMPVLQPSFAVPSSLPYLQLQEVPFFSSRLTPAPAHWISAIPRFCLINCLFFPHQYPPSNLALFFHKHTPSPPSFQQNKTTLSSYSSFFPFFSESYFLRNIKVYLLSLLSHLCFSPLQCCLCPHNRLFSQKSQKTSFLMDKWPIWGHLSQ